MVSDPTSGRLIMFGGAVDTPDGRKHIGDTWAYDPSTNVWTNLDPSGPPPAREAPAMAYDPATRKIVMFGGVRGGDAKFNDTWAYDPAVNTWTQLSPAGPSPPGRSGHVMVYDPPSGRMLMWGGTGREEGSFFTDLWAFDATTSTWTEVTPTGVLPAGRCQPAMAYDPLTRRMILFGGWVDEGPFGETWAYDPAANTWTELHPGGTIPSPRYGHELVCDPSRGLLVLFGGGDSSGDWTDTWTYDPAANTWTRVPALHGAAPSLQAHAMVYDPSGGRLIVFGGWSPQHGASNNTWAVTLE
jgi:N-acetylneuraminic acid mutarotase